MEIWPCSANDENSVDQIVFGFAGMVVMFGATLFGHCLIISNGVAVSAFDLDSIMWILSMV